MSNRKDWLYPILLFVLFVAITLPGIDWGVPSFWHPDELIRRIDKMIEGVYKLDATYFNHPFLPNHVYLWIGKLTYGLGHSRPGFIQAARLFNVLLAGGIIALVFKISRRAGAGYLGAVFAAAFTLSSSEIALNARIAHDDIFLGFFTTLGVYALVSYRPSGKDRWLYAAFLAVGLAASSKYNGASLVLAPAAVILLDLYKGYEKGVRSAVQKIGFGIILVILGFLLGTPEVVSKFRFFQATIQTIMLHHAEFNRQTDTVIGLLGQWEILTELLGAAAAILFLAAVLYHLVGLVKKSKYPWSVSLSDRKAIEAILLAILALDLPMLVVYNYPARFFLPIIPLLGVLAGIFIEDLCLYFQKIGQPALRTAVLAASTAVFCLSMLRVVSIGLLYQKDARIAASDYIARLPPHASIEYTFYPPTIPEKYFSRRSTYPLFFSKSMLSGELSPEGVDIANLGEIGLERRKTDYLIVDSLTSRRFEDLQTCAEIPNECDLFRRLPAGETHYQLLEKFEYQLPAYLPQLSPFFLNPTIWVYSRSPEKP